jgi:hypothetical protein
MALPSALRRFTRTRIAIVVVAFLCVGVGIGIPLATAAGGSPHVSVAVFDNDLVVVGLRSFPGSTSVAVNAQVGDTAGTGSITTDGSGRAIVGFRLPTDDSGKVTITGTITVTATAGQVRATGSLTLSTPAAPTPTVTARPTPTLSAPPTPMTPTQSATPPPTQAPPADTSGRLLAGSTDVNNTNAYPNSVIVPIPIAIPPGGVTVPAGANIQAAVDSNPAGTQFNLAAGTYSGQGVVHPKAGDKFYGVKAGPGGTTLNGIGIQRADSSTGDVEIHNLTITGFSDSGRDGAIDSNFHESNAASGWKITNSELTNDYVGASLGPKSLVENNTFHDNGCKGVAGGMDGTTWRYNQFFRNDQQGLPDPTGDCGGTKQTVMTNNQWIGNIWHDNGHPAGLWMDVSCHDNLFQGNISYDNGGSGFLDETGYNNTFKDNIVTGNGTKTSDGWRKTGIAIESSAHDTATGNFVWNNNGGAILIYMESRHDASGLDRVAFNTVTGNVTDLAITVNNVNISGPNTVSSSSVMPGNTMKVPAVKAGPQT